MHHMFLYVFVDNKLFVAYPNKASFVQKFWLSGTSKKVCWVRNFCDQALDAPLYFNASMFLYNWPTNEAGVSYMKSQEWYACSISR